MLSHVKRFLCDHFEMQESVTSYEPEKTSQLAAAALLIEVSRSDYEVDEAECLSIQQALQSHFELDKADIEQLVVKARQEVDTSVSLYQFTQLINSEMTAEEKTELVRLMWEVAFADGYLDKHEDHLIRKVADLMHVPHSEFIRTKLQVTGK